MNLIILKDAERRDLTYTLAATKQRGRLKLVDQATQWRTPENKEVLRAGPAKRSDVRTSGGWKRFACGTDLFFFFVQEVIQPILKQGLKLGVPTHNREAWPYGGFCLRSLYVILS